MPPNGWCVRHRAVVGSPRVVLNGHDFNGQQSNPHGLKPPSAAGSPTDHPPAIRGRSENVL
eukprot:7988220-Pyramimonas_sp.AAC.1